jgi:hypothetical protein
MLTYFIMKLFSYLHHFALKMRNGNSHLYSFTRYNVGVLNEKRCKRIHLYQ